MEAGMLPQGFELRLSGETFRVPGRYAAWAAWDAGVQVFEAGGAGGLSKLDRHLRLGGVAVLTGAWDQVLALHDRARRHGHDRKAAGRGGDRKGQGREGRSPRWNAGPGRRRADTPPAGRLLVMADSSDRLQVEPPLGLTDLWHYLGEGEPLPPGARYLVAVEDVLQTRESLDREFAVQALGAVLRAHHDVLGPRSQETYHLIRTALEAARPLLPRGARCLDMGCGSGVCTFLAAQVLSDLEPQVTATDHLPQALAVTRLNLRNLESAGQVPAGVVRVTGGGDLFEPLGDQKFHLILFNAPWVNARPRTAAETATHDQGREVVRRFLALAPRHLEVGGRVLLGFANHSGIQAVDRLQDELVGLGYTVEAVHTDRIQTHRSIRKWQRIMVYRLRLEA